MPRRPDATAADADTAAREHDLPHMGRMSLEHAIDMIYTGDVFLHRWDLARATGQDETLDIDDVRRMHASLLPLDEVLRRPGVFGPKVEPPADADEQTAFLCFLGRQV